MRNKHGSENYQRARLSRSMRASVLVGFLNTKRFSPGRREAGSTRNWRQSAGTARKVLGR